MGVLLMRSYVRRSPHHSGFVENGLRTHRSTVCQPVSGHPAVTRLRWWLSCCLSMVV